MPTLAELFARRDVSMIPEGGRDLLTRTRSTLPAFAKAGERTVPTRKVPEVEYKRGKTGTRPKATAKGSSFAESILTALSGGTPTAPQGSFADQLMQLRQQTAQQYLQPAEDPWQRIFTVAARSLAGRPELLADTKAQFAREDAARQAGIQDFLATEQAQSQAELDYQLERGKLAYDKLQKDGEDMAKAIGEFTADPDEQALLTFAVGQQLQASGTDDDTWTPMDRKNFVSQVYAGLRETGQLRGPRQEAPTTRTVQRGSTQVTEEFDPFSGTWKEIGAGPKFAPSEGAGALTLPQQANNSEIDSARARLMELGRTLPQGQTLQDAIQQNLAKLDPISGMPQPGYNPFLDTIARTAMQHKVGDDPEHTRWSRLIMSPAPIPVPELQQPDLSSLGPRQVPGVAAGQGNLNLGTAAPPAQTFTPRPGPAARQSGIAGMGIPELAKLFNDPNLTPAQRDEISARLSALGY